MRNKILTVFISCSIILVPAFMPFIQSEPSKAISTESIVPQPTNHISTGNEREQMKQIYQDMIKKIVDNKDPTSELSQLFFHPEIQKNINIISDELTVDIISQLLSSQNILTKLNSLIRYNNHIENQRSNNTIQYLERILDTIIVENLSFDAPDYIIPPNFQTKENQTYLINEWNSYLNNNWIIHEILSMLRPDPVIFFLVFAITMGIWGFTIGAASCCIPELIPIGVMFIESLLLGLGSSILVDFIFQNNFPLIDTIVQTICSLLYITPMQLEILTGCIVCLITIGAYLWLWNVCPINQLIKALGGGAFVVTPPFIISWFMASFPMNPPE